MRGAIGIAVATLLVLAMIPGPRLRAADDPSFTQWADAVLAHIPGTPDAAVQTALALTPNNRKAILDRLKAFLFVMSDPTAGDDGRVKIEPSLNEKAIALHRSKLTPEGFLERAAMLHADAVMFDGRAPVDAQAAAAQRTVRTLDPGMPAYQAPQSMFTALDGEVTGAIVANWNWSFARALLDLIVPIPADDTFVSIWYHATTAYMLRQGEFGEALPNLEHAAQALPNDARVAFDRGCLAESFAMNQFQQLVSDDRAATVFARGHSPHTPGEYAGVRLTIPDPKEANAQAKAFFEQAIAANPDLVEAHVRLARELELAGDYGAAMTHARRALTLSPPDDVAFYAHLFGARAADALGHADEAEAHVQAALALYPTAGSAIIAASQIAVRRADPGTAVERLDRLTDAVPNGEKSIDPWRQYLFGAGRAAELPLTELWHRVPRFMGR